MFLIKNGFDDSKILFLQRNHRVFQKKIIIIRLKYLEKVLEMSKSIKEAISIDTFLEVKHLGRAAAVIIDNDCFKGRRHANQAFQVYDLWRNQNQSPSFLSFKNEDDQEQFIILSGPHRPRYLQNRRTSV